MIQDSCGTTKAVKNTGSDTQCLTKPTVAYALGKSSQSFASVTAFRTKTAWDTAKEAKDIVVLYSVERSELANVEATYFESRTRKIETKAARKGLKVTHLLGYCSHAALESYMDSDYIYIYEFTEDGQIKGIVQEDGTVTGQLLSSFVVGPVNEPVIEGDPQTSVVDMVYYDARELTKSGAVVTPDFDVLKYKGIYPVTLTVEGTPSATELKIRATYGCSDKKLTGLVLADFILKTAAGATQTPDSVSAGTGDDVNLYTFVDTDLATGTIETDVVVTSLAMFETDASIEFTVS